MTNRQTDRQTDGQTDKWTDARGKRVSQGSLLGPLLFLLFINDIVKRIGAYICLFANDTCLYIIVDLLDQASIILNTDLKQFLIGKIIGFWLSMQAKHCQ